MKSQVILRNLQWSGRHNPGFPPGSTQTAVAELLNPTSSILPYSARLCLDKPAIVCTGTIFFNIDAGKTKNVNFQILMPTVEGIYPVHLDVFSNDQLLETYRATDDVVIGVIAEYTLEVVVEPPGVGLVLISPSKATYSAGEVVTLVATPNPGYEFDHWGGWPPYPGVGSTSDTLSLTMDADWWVVAAFRKAAPVTTVTVTLQNPPANSDGWSLGIVAHDLSGSRGSPLTSLAHPVIHKDIPSAWFPLYAFVAAFSNRVPIWQVTSDPKSDWLEWYNPDFIIPSPGNYILKADTERFVKF